METEMVTRLRRSACVFGLNFGLGVSAGLVACGGAEFRLAEGEDGGRGGGGDATAPADAWAPDTDGGPSPREVRDANAACDALPDPNRGAFVSLTGTGTAETTGCTHDAPCKTIEEAAAWARLPAQQRSTVYIDEGVYTEQIVARAGLTYQGGWRYRQGGSWTRLCDEAGPVPGAVTIKAPAGVNVTAVAKNIKGETVLEALSLVGRAAAAAVGESMYGIMAVGDKELTTVRLVDVWVSAPRAGDGAKGGDPGVAAPGTTGGCTPGTSAATTPAAGRAGEGGELGIFDASGYHPANGTAGQPGGAGGNGMSGIGDSSGTNACQRCRLGHGDDPRCGVESFTVVGGAGIPGCGGASGAAGQPGGGGGSSVAVFAWNAQVVAERGSLTSSNGGRGGAGSGGGKGGEPGSGARGTSAGCTSVAAGCASEFKACKDYDVAGSLFNGGSGTDGAKGSDGGEGGGGGGGNSYAYYAGGNGSVTVNGTKLAHGEGGGAGGGGSPVARAGVGADRGGVVSASR